MNSTMIATTEARLLILLLLIFFTPLDKLCSTKHSIEA
jgi:hypothetical protein